MKRNESPRYTVRAWRMGQPRALPRFESGTEEPEVLAAWVAKEYPNERISIFDEYAGEAYIYREGIKLKSYRSNPINRPWPRLTLLTMARIVRPIK
jgi:hypothetical protein